MSKKVFYSGVVLFLVMICSLDIYSENLPNSNSQEDIKALNLINTALKNEEKLSPAKIKSLYFEKIDILGRLNKFDEKKELLNKFKKKYPKDVEVYSLEGWMYMGKSDFKNAIKFYEYYLANITPDEKNRYNIKSVKTLLLNAYNASGMWDKALALSKTMKVDPLFVAFIYRGKADDYLNNNKVDAAIELLKQASVNMPAGQSKAIIDIHLAQILRKHGRKKEAAKILLNYESKLSAEDREALKKLREKAEKIEKKK